MLILCAAALSTGVATWLLAPATRLAGEAPAAPTPPRRRPAWMLALLVPFLLVVIPAGRARAIAVACGVAAVFAVLAWRRRRAAKARRSRQQAVSRACWALAAEVAAGRVPAEALGVVAADEAVLRPAWRTAALGGDVVNCWRDESRAAGLEGLGRLASAWQLSARTGAPLADTIKVVAEDARRRQRLSHTVDAELAAPRATTRLLAALPLVGLALGLLVGGDPAGFLLDSLAGQACLVASVVLAGCGLEWGEHLASRAAP